MDNFKFRASKYHYPHEPINYVQMGAVAEENFPKIGKGEYEKRDFRQDLDCALIPEDIQVEDG